MQQQVIKKHKILLNLTSRSDNKIINKYEINCCASVYNKTSFSIKFKITNQGISNVSNKSKLLINLHKLVLQKYSKRVNLFKKLFVYLRCLVGEEEKG